MAKIVLTIEANNKATQSVKLLNAEVKTLAETLSSIKVNKNLTTQINALTKHYKAITDAQAKIIANKNKEAIADEKLRQQQEITRRKAEQANTEIERQNKLKIQTKKLEDSLARTQEREANSTKITASQVQKLEKGYAELLNTLNSIEKNYKKGTFSDLRSQAQSWFKEVQGLDAQLKSGAITQEQYNAKVLQATASLQGFKTEVASTRAESKTFRGTLLDIVSGFAKFQLSAMLVMKPLQALRNLWTSLNETLVNTEDRVIELQRVVGDVANANELYDLAAKYGQTFENVSEATLNFARRGMSWNESLKATEAALLAINVAELNVGQATDGLGAIMAQFGIEASDLTTVVDKLNKTADRFPVTTEKILAALQRTGSTASTAKLTLEETIGLITTLSKSTNRSGENIGTALNSILNISQKDSTLETFSKLSDNVAKTVEQYRSGGTSILEVLRAVSAEVQNLNTNQIFDTEAFSALNDDLKESMGEDFAMLQEIYGTAGTYRRNYFIALLNDLDTVKQVENEIADAQGYSQAENLKYVDTYTARLNSLQDKWKKIANDEQGWLSFKKGLVDLGSGILTVVDGMGGLKTIVAATAFILNKMFAGQIYTALLKFDAGVGSLAVKFTTLLKNIKSKDAWKNFFAAPKKSLDELSKATERYAQAQKLQKAATEAQVKATNLQVVANEKAALATKLAATQEANEVEISGMATAADAFQTAAVEAQTAATEAQVIADEKAVVAQKAVASASKEMGEAANAAAGIWGILAFAIYEAVTMLDKGIAEWTKDTTQEQLDSAKETVNAFTEITDKYNEQISAVKNYADVIKNINGVLNDENSSAIQLEYANNQLLNIQSELIKSNEEYAKSLDLVNGKLDEQSEIVRAKTEEESRKIADEYLERNSGAVEAAKKVIEGTNSRIELGTGDIGSKFGEIDILQQAINSIGLDNASAEVWKQGGTVWELPIGGGLINEAMEAADGQHSFSIMNSITRGLTDVFTKEGWTGKSIARLNLSGSVTEQLEAIEQIRKYLYENQNNIDENAYKNIQTQLEAQYRALNSDDYKNALKTIETDEMYSQFTKGGISLGQFQKWLAGDKEWATSWINSLEHLSEVEKNNLVSAMEEARDLQKEALELSEKQLAVEEARVAVEEARIALENAQNQATVRRFNEATGQWEWQVDEKKVAEAQAKIDDAQEKLKDAQQNLTDYAEDKAWNETKTAIEKGNATNKSILDILAKWAEASMQEDPEFVKEIKGIIQSSSGVNIENGEVKVSQDGTQTVYENGKPKVYDSGGIANGLGFMHKATELPETVNDPELTRKILTPVSNAEFDRYVKDMGIMFATAKQYSQNPIIERVGGNTDNRVDNSRQVFVNGVNVGAEKRDTLLDALSLSKIVPN